MIKSSRWVPVVPVVAALCATGALHAGLDFVNWESPHVHPLDLTPDGATLLAVNTADNRLEVFQTTVGGLVHVVSIPVGLDPVSVRARSNDEAWVVNHVSDSISVVDLVSGNVRATINTGDEPADVIFAGDPLRAFVTVSQLNQIKVYDPDDLAAAPVRIDVQGEDPRALATDGTNVYAAIFEAGNGTTILDEDVVSSNANPYPGDPNPPPNDGAGFSPPIAPGLPDPPNASLIVKKDSGGAWRDDNGGDWSGAVSWDLHGHDVVVVRVSDLAVSYVTGVCNLTMGLGVGPGGDLFVIGTDATNHVRFEPNIRGTFVRVMGARIAPGATTPSALADLNPHLDYAAPTVDQSLRDQSIGDPRGVAFAGARVFVTGMGSSNVIETNASLDRIGRVAVGQGPTGIVVNDAGGVLYTLNKLEGTVSVVDLATLTESGLLAFHDPTPDTIKSGRPHLYDTHATSGLGQASCGSCHVDGRLDQIAWDLGDPTGAMKPFNQICNFGLGGCEDWHPMKGPMTTQTLVGIVGTEPLHWRADREDLAAFNGAFESLLGDDEQLTPAEMDELTDFIATLTPPPNPNRTMSNGLRSSLPNGGNAITGASIFEFTPIDGGLLTCEQCHAFPTGTNGQLTSAAAIQESQSMKVPQLRNLHEKTGFDQTSVSNNRGFGFTHDGNVDTLFEFLQFSGFNFAGGATGDQQRRDVVAFLHSFATDTHAGVGVQATIGGTGPDQTTRRDEMIAIADGGAVGLVVKGIRDGEARGFRYLGGGSYQSDRAGETVTTAQLDAVAGAGAGLTWTLVPLGSETRIGVDRDGDGFLDRDELDACADPADAASFPGDGTSGCGGCPADVDGSGDVGFADLLAVLSTWGPCGGACPEDVDGSGDVGFSDLLAVLSAWGACE